MLLSMRTLVVVFAATIFLIVAGPASACYVDSTAGTLRTGETVHCCVTVHGSSGAKTSAFAIRVDEMSKLNFLNSYGDNSTFGVGGPVSSQTTNPALYGLTPSSGNALSAALTSKDVGIEISCNGKTNPFRRLYKVEDDSGVTTVANVMTAIVSVDQGVVQGVTWDYGSNAEVCWFCNGISDPRCKHNAYSLTTANVSMAPITTYGSASYGLDCMQPQSTCSPSTNCDLQVYVVFSGTDVDGRYLKSSSRRFSRFVSFSVMSIYESAYGTSSSIISQAQSLVNSVTRLAAPRFGVESFCLSPPSAMATALPDRLIDYFCVVAADEIEEDGYGRHESEGEQYEGQGNAVEEPPADEGSPPKIAVPKIVDRYPLEDHDKCKLADLPLVANFCMPHGEVTKYVPPEERKPSFFIFVLTRMDALHMFGSCLRFYERVGTTEDETMGRALYKPKVLCLLSHWPFFGIYQSFLRELYKVVEARVYPLPIERYICNFVSETPLPSPGEKIKLPLSGSRSWFGLATLSYERPAASALPPVEHRFFVRLFSCLDLNNILKAISLIMLEARIVVHSRHIGTLVEVAEALFQLVFPLHWTGTYVPLFPKIGTFQIAELLESPTPFFYGVKTEHLEEAKREMGDDLFDVCNVIDLDHNRLTPALEGYNAFGIAAEGDGEGGVVEEPGFPTAHRERLIRRLKNAVPHDILRRTQRVTSKGKSAGRSRPCSVWADDRKVIWQRWSGNRPVGDLSPSLWKSRIMAERAQRIRREEAKVMRQFGLDVVVEETGNHGRQGRDGTGQGSQLEVANENLHSNLQTLMELWITGDTLEDAGPGEDDLNIEDGFASWSDDVRCAFLEVQLMIMKDYRRYCVRSWGSGRLEDMFDKAQFLDSNPKDHRPFLERLVNTQSFVHFIQRALEDGDNDKDVQLFDETIKRFEKSKGKGAVGPNIDSWSRKLCWKKNRGRKVKERVCLGPSSQGLGEFPPPRAYLEETFPKLDPTLFGSPRPPSKPKTRRISMAWPATLRNGKDLLATEGKDLISPGMLRRTSSTVRQSVAERLNGNSK